MHQPNPKPTTRRNQHGSTRNRLFGRITLVLGSGLAVPAWAHHPMGGEAPTTMGQGLLSGLAHPVIGPDHLAFLLAAALLAAWGGVRGGRGAMLCLAFVGAGAAGTLARQPGLEWPWAEAGVALSLLALAVMLLWKRLPAVALTLAFALACGGVHGWAYGEAVLGAEAAPIGAYVLALAAMQACLLAATHRLGLWFLRVMPSSVARGRQLAAAVSLAVGLMALAGALAV